MRTANQILNGIREYEATYGKPPTHVTLTIDEHQSLERELGKVIVVGSKLFDLVEVRVNDNIQTGTNMIQPTRGKG